MVNQQKKIKKEELLKQKLKIRNIISITVLSLLQIQNLYLSEYLLVDCPNLQSFWLFLLQYTKEKAIKMYFLVILFHWIETERIAKNLIEISKFELSVEKKNEPDLKSHFSHCGVKCIF